MFKNMKIEINEEQSLDKVVKELDRLGYDCWAWSDCYTCWVFTWDDGDYTNTEDLNDIDHQYHKTTTLTEIKQMEK